MRILVRGQVLAQKCLFDGLIISEAQGVYNGNTAWISWRRIIAKQDEVIRRA